MQEISNSNEGILGSLKSHDNHPESDLGGDDVVSFSRNWNNKLQCQYFTTLRLHNPRKYVKKATVSIHYAGRFMTKAQIISVRTLYGSELNEFICGLDTGLTVHQTLEVLEQMYSKFGHIKTLKFDLVLLHKIANLPDAIQQSLL